MTLSDGTYEITNAKSHTVVDLSGSDNKNIIGYTPNNGANQRWRLRNVGGDYYTVQSVATNTYITFEGEPENGRRLTAGEDAQRWRVEVANASIHSYRCVRHSKSSRHCADTDFRLSYPGTRFTFDLSDYGNANDGTAITLWEQSDGNHQTWLFRPCEFLSDSET